MKHKSISTTSAILVALVLIFTPIGLAGGPVNTTGPARTGSPNDNVTLDEADFSPVGGFSGVDSSLSLWSASRPPSHLTEPDYQAIYTEAKPLLDRGIQFRTTEIQIVPANTITDALQNYSNFNEGELFYTFCADYDYLEEHGTCPTGGENVRNKLVHAIELYSILLAAPTHVTMEVEGQEVPVTEVGRQGVLSATREIANVHLIFGNEFLIDATDYRFSSTAANADQIINEELGELEQALQQFRLATDIMSYAFNTPLGGEVRDFMVDDRRIGDYFTSREFELFGMVSNRMMTTLGEMAVRYRLSGEDDKALALYDEAYTTQYVQTMALAQKALELDADYLQNGSWEMLNNLSQMRERAQAIRSGSDPFGFASDYVPLQSYEDLLELTEGLLETAGEFEDNARDAQRRFDEEEERLEQELQDLTDEYNDALFDLCGESDNDYDTCEGGLMQQNLCDLYAASLRVGRAWQRVENKAEQIKIEEERVGHVINVTLGLGQTISAAELAIGKLEAYRETATEVSSSEDQVHLGVEAKLRAYFQVETTVSTNPINTEAKATAGLEVSLEGTAGYQHAWSWISSTEKKWDPTAEAIRGYESLKALKEAEAQAEIEGANSAAVIKNLLLQQSELLLEYEIALEEFNKVVAEHNHLAQRYSRLLNKRALAVNRVIQHNSHLVNPAYRVMRDTLTVRAAEAIDLAAQFAYLTAKAAEYDLLTPYPSIGEIYKARTANDIRRFLDDLIVWYQAADRPGQLNRYPYTISIAKDILGLTDENLDPEGTMTQEELEQLRYERFQEFLQQQILEDGTLEFQFATSLDQRRSETQYLFETIIWNNRIAGIGEPLEANEGVSLNIVTRQTGDVGRPVVVLKHGGQASYRNPTGDIVHYDPGTAVPVGYVLPAGLNPADTTVVLRPGINGEGAIPNSGLINLSVAASSWTFRIPIESKGYLDYSQIEDFEIYLDTSGRALPGHEAQAERDALRLQAGLGLEPVTDDASHSASHVSRSTPHVSRVTPLAPPPVSPATITDTGVISGSYFGNVVITSPLPVGVQVLCFDLTDLGGVLSGTVNTTRTMLFSGTMGLHGSVDGVTFTIASDVITTVVSGRTVRQSFTLVGHIEEGGDTLKGAYTGVISDFMATPIIVQGHFLGSRPGRPGGSLGEEVLVVDAEQSAVLTGGSTGITARYFDGEGRPITQTTRITFTTDLGTISPTVTDTIGGVAVTTFTAGDSAGWAHIIATTGQVTGTAKIEVRHYRYVYLPFVLKNE